jgi:hypothetical protein
VLSFVLLSVFSFTSGLRYLGKNALYTLRRFSSVPLTIILSIYCLYWL